ncbi:hypothetical protein PG997_002517 [Apiospora hydei]|uniref:Uncharacterized protein n=1 Tax=Apiospora hydei TaxID=1337664 RepID=A0ABR1WWN4_9PEZI
MTERQAWDDEFHEIERGWGSFLEVQDRCGGWFTPCRGLRWFCKAERNPGPFMLYYKCIPHHGILHPQHEHFQETGFKFQYQDDYDDFSDDYDEDGPW